MLLFCPNGHEQTGLSAMGGLCEVCLKEDPETFACNDPDCPENVKGQHFHPDERSYFLEISGNRVG